MRLLSYFIFSLIVFLVATSREVVAKEQAVTLQWCKAHCSMITRSCRPTKVEKVEKCIPCWNFHTKDAGVEKCLHAIKKHAEKIEHHLNQEPEIRVSFSCDNKREEEIRKKSKACENWEKVILKINKLDQENPLIVPTKSAVGAQDKRTPREYGQNKSLRYLHSTWDEEEDDDGFYDTSTSKEATAQQERVKSSTVMNTSSATSSRHKYAWLTAR